MGLEDLRLLLISLSGPIIGSAIGVYIKAKERTLNAFLSFAGGTMLGISFLQILPESLASCGIPGTAAGLLAGFFLVAFISEFTGKQMRRKGKNMGKLEFASIIMIITILMHNLPEGIALVAGTKMPENSKALQIALAIAIHDIPEGICTSAPYYFATGNRKKAFFLSVSTGIPVILGYFLGKTIFRDITAFALGTVIAIVAGMMICVTCKELLPNEREDRSDFLLLAMLLGIILVIVLEKL